MQGQVYVRIEVSYLFTVLYGMIDLLEASSKPLLSEVQASYST